jgi:hypothetical protein
MESVPLAEKEIAEASGAQGAWLALNQRTYDILTYTLNQVRSIAPDLKPEQARTLRTAYAIGPRRISLRRVSELRLLLEQTINAPKVYGDTLKASGRASASPRRARAHPSTIYRCGR